MQKFKGRREKNVQPAALKLNHALVGDSPNIFTFFVIGLVSVRAANETSIKYSLLNCGIYSRVSLMVSENLELIAVNPVIPMLLESGYCSTVRERNTAAKRTTIASVDRFYITEREVVFSPFRSEYRGQTNDNCVC
ncbi:hypothetical protein QE152_g19945 [Popillia japonica]|uniref:Uncharacterized protein n=1 Tax=Popillia japonica TaxID=7064 RepID=A0AAW1KM94_POPJA